MLQVILLNIRTLIFLQTASSTWPHLRIITVHIFFIFFCVVDIYNKFCARLCDSARFIDFSNQRNHCFSPVPRVQHYQGRRGKNSKTKQKWQQIIQLCMHYRNFSRSCIHLHVENAVYFLYYLFSLVMRTRVPLSPSSFGTNPIDIKNFPRINSVVCCLVMCVKMLQSRKFFSKSCTSSTYSSLNALDAIYGTVFFLFFEKYFFYDFGSFVLFVCFFWLHTQARRAN